MSEAEKYDELFDMDKQDYDFNHIKIKKKEVKKKNKFDLDAMKVEGDDQKTNDGGSENTAGDTQDEDTPSQKKPKPEGGDGENPNERSVEMLSDDDEDDYDVDDKGNKIDHDLKDEKPLEIFKSLFSDFKEFIPKKAGKDEPPAPPMENKKERFFSKAKGFFGL